MITPRYEVAHILEMHKDKLGELCTNSWQKRTLHAIRKCRTEALGGHIDKCTNPDCNKLHLSYNSCRNRHCPKCQGHKREQWIQARRQELFNVPYFHVVFTLPSELNTLCQLHPKTMYSLLFSTAWSVIKDFSSNVKFLGATPGMVAILHTWGQNLSLHPHLHCIIPGGGISAKGKWKTTRNKGKYLFPEKGMRTVFRARFVNSLRKEFTSLTQSLYDTLYSKQWVVYCKQPFLGPLQVVEYLGRYTHKIAISNHRIKDITDNKVTFSAKDYRHKGKKVTVELSHYEFIRRFSLHVLPKGFTRIRHYGILSSSKKKQIIPLLQKELGTVSLTKPPVLKHLQCPYCKKGNLVTLTTFDSRGPPKGWLEKLHKNPHKTTP